MDRSEINEFLAVLIGRLFFYRGYHVLVRVTFSGLIVTRAISRFGFLRRFQIQA